MTYNKTSIALSASSSSSVSTPTTATFRTQLGQLIPKHALFQVHLHIEQLSNVPLTSGQFAVKWKFKNVQSPNAGLLGKMKHRAVSSPSLATGKWVQGRKDRVMPHIEVTDEEHGDYRSSYEGDSERASSERPRRPSTASYGRFLTASPPETPVPPSAAPTITQAMTPLETHAEARGVTDWVKLQSYNARWEHDVSVLVQMDVHRETGDLLPNELKLSVVQRIIHGDPNAPNQPRLGRVFLNLAEYADAGPVTRRYLLRDSKTNATLKLTIELEHIGGEKNYRPPPLRKGEIMASVTGLLANNDLYRTKLARDLDLYARADDRINDDWANDQSPYSNADGHVDFDRLASSDGLRTTEGLIDAIFNPVPTASDKASPFTYYDPEKAREAEERSWASERQSTHSSLESGYTAESSGRTPSGSYAGSEHSSSQDSHRHWWQKIRPSTPLSKQFRPSTPSIAGFSTRLPS